MIFEVTVGSKWWCKVLGSVQCSGVSDLIVQINLILVDAVQV